MNGIGSESEADEKSVAVALSLVSAVIAGLILLDHACHPPVPDATIFAARADSLSSRICRDDRRAAMLDPKYLHCVDQISMLEAMKIKSAFLQNRCF